jgi:hypothetical protein
MTISPRRDRIGRLTLTVLGAGGVVAGALGVLGLRSPQGRAAGVLIGLAAIANGAQIIRIARGEKAEGAARDPST